MQNSSFFTLPGILRFDPRHSFGSWRRVILARTAHFGRICSHWRLSWRNFHCCNLCTMSASPRIDQRCKWCKGSTGPRNTGRFRCNPSTRCQHRSTNKTQRCGADLRRNYQRLQKVDPECATVPALQVMHDVRKPSSCRPEEQLWQDEAPDSAYCPPLQPLQDELPDGAALPVLQRVQDADPDEADRPPLHVEQEDEPELAYLLRWMMIN